MVKFVPPQDMFEYEADYYVNTVNTVGVPGAGVALQFANRCPQETKKYIDFCKSHQDYGVETLSGGDIFVYNNVVFAFTKEHYRNNSRYEWISKLFINMAAYFDKLKGKLTIVSPPPGCGLGGLSWGLVRDMAKNSPLKDSKHTFVFIEQEKK